MKKKYVLTLVTLFSVFCTNLTLKANTQTTNIPVQFSNPQIIVDGMVVKTSNQPFIYNGITYLPVRDIASVSGKIVNWDYNNKAIILTSANVNQSNTQQNNKPIEQSTQKPNTQQLKPSNNIKLSDGNYVAGEDFPAGKYNIRCISGSGSVLSDNSIEGGISSIMASPEKLEEYKKIGMSIGITEFNNCNLPNGTSLSVSGSLEQLTIELIPVK